MEYTAEELLETKRQIDSIINKLRRALASLKGSASNRRSRWLGGESGRWSSRSA